MPSLSNRRISRFALIGGASTLIYAACAFILSGGIGPMILPAVLASIAAYAAAAIFSYAGHKYVTFVSGGAHVFEAPRFVALTALGLAISWFLPAVLVGGFGLAPLVPIMITCIVVPVLNYVVLDRWVFASGTAVGEKRAAR